MKNLYRIWRVLSRWFSRGLELPRNARRGEPCLDCETRRKVLQRLAVRLKNITGHRSR